MEGLDLHRTVYIYGVAGRRRTAAASAMMKMLRAYDWTKFMTSSDAPPHAQLLPRASLRAAIKSSTAGSLAIIRIDKTSLDLPIHADNEGGRNR